MSDHSLNNQLSNYPKKNKNMKKIIFKKNSTQRQDIPMIAELYIDGEYITHIAVRTVWIDYTVCLHCGQDTKLGQGYNGKNNCLCSFQNKFFIKKYSLKQAKENAKKELEKIEKPKKYNINISDLGKIVRDEDIDSIDNIDNIVEEVKQSYPGAIITISERRGGMRAYPILVRDILHNAHESN